MVRSFARWMAKRLHRRQKLRQSLRWYDLWGAKRMSISEKVDYAGLLHDIGESNRAVHVLTDILTKDEVPQAYERRAHIYNELGREEEAIADLNAAIRLDSEPYIYWYTRAIAHHDRGEYDQSVRDFKEALSRREDSKASTYYELGNVFMKQESFKEAEACYRQASSDPDRAIPHYYYRQAQALEKLGRTDEALAALAKAIRLQDSWSLTDDRGAAMLKTRTNYSHAAVASFLSAAQDEYGFRLYQSKLLEAAGQEAAALASIDEALAQFAGTAELELRRANLLRLNGRLPESIEALKRLKDDHPQWLPVFMELSTSYRITGEYAAMIEELLAAKERFSEHTVVRFWLADAYREAGQAEEARKENEELTAMEPDDPLNWKQRAEIAIDADRFPEADEAYSKAIQLEETADYYMRRSFSRYMEDRYEDAMMDIQSATKLDDNLEKMSKTAFAMGELYVGMGNWNLADAEYSRALAMEPDNPHIYDRRARCRFAADRMEDALSDCNRGLLLDPTHSRLTWLRGLIQYRLDDHEAALADSLAYAELVPDDSQGQYNLGLIYNHLDRHDEAIAAFTKVIEMNPFEAQAYLERASLWYHYAFDRLRASDDLAQWLLYAGGDKPQDDRFALLSDIRGFDDDMRERAKEQFLHMYGNSRYLS
ncbi:tetratricopeptide repeat protein [Cohnella endophytica]|uniref:tetratricopeptide repeat protein n=1 Tax=Cohnella endophytica TaxID=2419778 RepID=UPI00131473DB|nr:tetratricopeptide repeat protein [Cohnella endophytica]